MTCDTSITRPLDSFIKYFYDIKPYHTKILEVIEQYHFKEDIHVDVQENMNLEVTMANDPLCKGVGFGLDFDDECGFDALDCCDLFDCAGGFGLIYDNSDMLLEIPIDNIDVDAGEITVSGYHLYDTYINIKSVPNTNTIILDGDHSQYFDHHKMFWVVRRNAYPITSQTSTTITVEGNVVNQILAKRNLELQMSGLNDGHYGVIDATFDSGNTIITVNRELESTTTLGRILVSSSNKNNGIYQILDYTIQGTETHLNLAPSTPAALTDSDLNDAYGSIRLRTGTIPMRRVWLGEPVADYSSDRQWRVVAVKIDPTTQSTIITVDGMLDDSLSDPTLRIYGYESGAGFDGEQECTNPKPFNVHTYFSEFLLIEVEEEPLPTPSATPPASVSPTPTPVPTPEPEPECSDIWSSNAYFEDSENFENVEGFVWGVTPFFLLYNDNDDSFSFVYDSDNDRYELEAGDGGAWPDCGNLGEFTLEINDEIEGSFFSCVNWENGCA